MASDVLKIVDLFAGAGGFSLAAVRSGCELVFAVESDKKAATTYKKNICIASRSPNCIMYNQQIEELNADALAEKHFKNQTCDILLGGPPCQGFSAHRINDAGVNDPRNKLIYKYFEYVEALKPRAFLMENVPGMLWERHKNYVENFYKQAALHYYKVFKAVKLDARDYGVPQRRQRVFILGFRKDINFDTFIWPPQPTHSDPRTMNKSGQDLLPWVNCKGAFEKAPKNDPNDIHMNHNAELVEVFRNTPHNGGSRKDSGRVLPCHREHDGHKDVYGRINPEKPAPTMTTACVNPSKGRFVHPTANHGITARQAARIQTFPDDYVFEGGHMAAAKQIGNAVPVMLGIVLIQHIKTLLQEQKSFCIEKPIKKKTLDTKKYENCRV